jgi:hypothetical protein
MSKVEKNLFSGICKSFGTVLLFMVFTLSSATGAQALSFNTAVPYSVGNTPYSVATGDFNRDGKLDLAVANQGTNNVTILLGNGDGTFTEKLGSPFNVGNLASGPVSIAVGDFDRDGNLDIATANNFTSNVSILLGDGTGNFTAAGGSPFGLSDGVNPALNPVAVATADFNLDGKLDLVVANTNSNNISVLLGGNAGTLFGAAINFNVGSNPVSVATGDFNLDGKPDIVVANLNTNTVSILLGDGTGGTFIAAAGSPLGGLNAPTFVATSDFNGDGKLDLAVTNGVTNTVSIFLGIGGGTFGARGNFNSGSSPISITPGDFNGDGIQDLTVVSLNVSNVSVFPGNGDGTFATGINFGTGGGPRSVVSGDFNRDGKPDLAVANSGGGSNSVSVLINSTSFGTAGVFDKVVSSNVGTGPSAITNADFNLDGKPDLAVANFVSNNVSVLRSAGFGNFFAAFSYAAGTGPSAITTGDFDLDGKPDIAVADAVADSSGNNVSILRNNPANLGTFLAARSYAAGTGPSAIAVGDFDLDGKPDLAVANDSSNNVSILRNNPANLGKIGRASCRERV